MPPAQPGGFQPAAAPYGAQPAGQQSNGLAITSLVLGIIGLLTFWACGGGGLLGIGAVVFGFLGLNKAKEMNDNGKGLAMGGIITGGLAIVISVLAVLFWWVLADSAVDDLNDQIEQDLEELDRQLEEEFGEINSDPADGFCDEDRFVQDPDC